jgi:hypothetical protein
MRFWRGFVNRQSYRFRQILSGIAAALLFIVGTLAVVPGRCSGADLGDPPKALPYPDGPAHVRLDPIPKITLPPPLPPSATESAHIKQLIAQLAQIDHPDFGMSPTMSGTAFAPISGSQSAGAFLLTNPGLKRSDAFTELVRLGPRALPFLLAAVDDKTPTRYTVGLGGILSWMQFSNEFPINLANVREKSIVAKLPNKEFGFDPNAPKSHVVTVGDVCFVAIGQIVGRSYQAVRYQPSGGMVVNSPTYDPAIAQTVRAIWSSDNPTQHLLDSLLLDYSTRGIREGGPDGNFDNWYVGSTPQIGAAMRLLFYFPRETAPLIAHRLNALSVTSGVPGSSSWGADRQFDLWIKRELANEMRTDDFLKAIAWSHEPVIRQALRSIFEKTDSLDILLASAPAMSDFPNSAPVAKRFQTCINSEINSDGNQGASKLLASARKVIGDKALPLYRSVLRRADVQACFCVCDALNDSNGDWDREFLWPLLTDTRAMKDNKHWDSPKAEALIPTRVCDAAAEAISKHRPDLAFEMNSTTEQLNAQIRKMRQVLADSPPALPH